MKKSLLIIIFFDQFIKALVLSLVKYEQKIHLNKFFDFNLTFNKGYVFCLFNEIAISFLIIIIFLILFYMLIDIKKDRLFLLIIFSGISNLIDRLTFGFVIDYISIYYNRYHFLTFNLADIFISYRISIFIYRIIKKSK